MGYRNGHQRHRNWSGRYSLSPFVCLGWQGRWVFSEEVKDDNLRTTNIAPENRPSQTEIVSSNHWFSGSMFVSWRANVLLYLPSLTMINVSSDLFLLVRLLDLNFSPCQQKSAQKITPQKEHPRHGHHVGRRCFQIQQGDLRIEIRREAEGQRGSTTQSARKRWVWWVGPLGISSSQMAELHGL